MGSSKRPRSGRGASTPRTRAGKGRPAATSEPNGATVTATWIRNVDLEVAEPKQPISFRVDSDVLQFFRERGPGYQTRMNAVLRAYVTAHGEE
jgi:uncharacterized protein (DUF4415 family)